MNTLIREAIQGKYMEFRTEVKNDTSKIRECLKELKKMELLPYLNDMVGLTEFEHTYIRKLLNG